MGYAMSLSQSIAPQILAAATKSVFPSAKLIAYASSPLCFSYDFAFDFDFSKEHLSLIDERLKQLLSREQKPDLLEMLPFNASEMLAHHKEHIRAESVRRAKTSTVKIFRLDAVVDYVEGKVSKDIFNFAALAYFEKLEKGRVRLFAVCAKEKDELKHKIKEAKRAGELSHLATGSAFFAMRPEGVYWHTAGVTLRERIRDAWKEGYALIKTPTLEPLSIRFDRYAKGGGFAEMGEALAKEIEGQGLFGLPVVTSDLARFVGDRAYIEEAFEAAIQKISLFWGGVAVDGLQSITFKAKDLYGYERAHSSILVKELPTGLLQLDVTVFLSLEAYIAALIEKNEAAIFKI